MTSAAAESYTEAVTIRGWDHAKVRVILGDGAVWIWNIADRAVSRRLFRSSIFTMPPVSTSGVLPSKVVPHR